MGRTDGAGAEDDLLGFHGEGVAAAIHQQSHRLCPFKNDPADLAIGPHRQVEPVAGLPQVAQGGAEPDSVVVVGHARADTVGVRMVVVVGFLEPAGPTGR